MKTSAGSRFVGWSCAVLVGLAAPAVGWAGERFTLTAAVPDDVFVCFAAQDNPERKFIEDYWSEVLEVLSQAGFTADLMDLIGLVGGQEGQAEVQKYRELATELIKAVDWGQLAGQEFVFAIRLPQLRQSNGGFNVSPPGEAYLFLGTPGSGAKNYAGLVTILETLLAQVKGATGFDFPLVKAERGGANVTSVIFQPSGADGEGGISVSLAQRQDVIIITLGGKMLDEVLGLLASEGSTQSLAASQRYQQAFADLPPAEDIKMFFDMQRLLTGIHAIADPIFTSLAGPQDQFLSTGQSAQADHLIGKALEAYKKGDYEHAITIAKAAHKHDSTDTVVMYDLACFNAMLGKKEKALEWLDKAVEGGFYAPRKLRADSDLDSLRDDPRFQEIANKAYARAGGTPEVSGADGQQQKWAALAQVIAERILGTMGIMDYSAMVEYTTGHTTHSDAVCVLTADARSNPFYPVFGKSEPLTDFAKYLPQETIGYSVSSGPDLIALYTFLEQSIKMVGPPGEELLANWAAIQQQVGFDVRKDLLSWLQGDSVSATVRLAAGEGWVSMIKVADEAAARDKLMGALEMIGTKIKELAATNPQLAMFAVQVTPATNEKLAGFKRVTLSIMPMAAAVVGVADGYIVLGSSEEVAALCLATGAGEHPNVTSNAQVMAEALVPQGPFTMASFTDLRSLGAQIAAGLQVIQMVAGFAAMAIPPDAQPVIQKVLSMLAKLTPAAEKINFYKSSSTLATFDGQVWRTQSITNYASPAERG